ncbi:phospholipase [Streptomyces noursei]|uniref:phospholipase n=1 Tax=Streptomyces noursei TaxID=1971 RepID=UPI0023B8372B|nr:phospholipase [Streptomyces noursei]
MSRRLAAALVTPLLAVFALAVAAAPAQAVPADKPQVMASFTQTSAASYGNWLAARNAQGNWAAYAFDWSTDYCSKSPDNPFGFPFKLSCARHDFGYRNYKKAGTFAANKPRLDSALYEDLKRVCAGYSGAKKTSCSGLAWTYYQAVKKLGK